MSIYDYDNDFNHYEHADKKERQKLGQVWTLFQALGKGAVPNTSFWEASLELMKQ